MREEGVLDQALVFTDPAVQFGVLDTQADVGIQIGAQAEQAGIFVIRGLEGENLRRLMGTFCLTILFPYLRETVDSLCLKGSFPPLVLAPINFDQLYEQSMRQQQGQAPETHA